MKINRNEFSTSVLLFSIMALCITLIERAIGGTMLISRIFAFISLILAFVNVLFILKRGGHHDN